jgi:hypothetical protein
MKEPRKAYAIPVLLALVAACMLSNPQSLVAQKSGAQPYPPPRPNRASTQPPGAPNGADPRAQGATDTGESWRREKLDTETVLLRRQVAAELAEDFQRLRRINKENLEALSSAGPLDYTQLAQVVGEVNKRAKRIKSNSPLLLFKEKKVERSSYEEDASQLGSMLPELRRLIDSFLSSPTFQVTSAIDDELRSTAGRDLEGIVRLSATINKIAKRLARISTQRA